MPPHEQGYAFGLTFTQVLLHKMLKIDPKGSEKFIQDCPSADKELKLYPGARHSIFSLETDEVFNTVFNDMKQWLDKHTTTEAKP